MNLKALSKSELCESTRSAVTTETSSITNVVRHFREIYDRRLFLELGYSSMFKMAVDDFGYDKQSAQRRVSAMELSLSVPDLLEKIDRKELCLQSAADLQSFLNQERGAKRRYSSEQTRELVEVCSGLSTRQVQVELAKRNPNLDFRESKRSISEDRVLITHTVSVALEEKLESIRNLLSHVNPFMKREELLDCMAEITLDAICPIRKAQRAEARRRKSAQNPAARQALNEVMSPDLTANQFGAERESFSAQRIEFSEEVVSEVGEIQLVATFEDQIYDETRNPSRYIGAKDSHQVWLKNRSTGCEYVSPITGRRCGTRHLPQRDHVIEFAKGGSNSHENLRLYCGRHNRWRSTVQESTRDYYRIAGSHS